MPRSNFPMFLYLYGADGMHDRPIEIESEEVLNGAGVRFMVRSHIDDGLEVRITDPGDHLVFHAEHGEVVWPTKEEIERQQHGHENDSTGAAHN